MKASKVRFRRSVFARVLTLAMVATGLAVVVGGCDGGSEGDRCVSQRSSDECGSGLSCQQIGGCGESYCCPADPSKSSNPYCNGTGFDKCPAADASAGDDAGDAATADAPAGDTSTSDTSTTDSPADSPRDALGEGATD